MSNAIYVIKAGANNYFWDESRQRSIAALMLGRAYYDAWSANDEAAHLAIHQARAAKGQDPSLVKAESTRWFNYASKIAKSAGDIFLNIDGNDVWWTRSLPSHAEDDPQNEYVSIPHIDPLDGQEAVAVGVRTDGWRQFTKDGVKLQLGTIHKRAWDFIKKQSALSPVADEDMKLYFTTLLEAGDLTPWHSRPTWKAKQGEDKGKYLPIQASLLENGLTQLMLSIEGTVAVANGQIIDRKLKDKKLLVHPEVMKQHLKTLWELQEGKCALTGIHMHLPGQPDLDKDLMLSPDRMDSDGHYSTTNVQLVCRFANFWKLASDNARFKELLDLVVQTKSSAADHLHEVAPLAEDGDHGFQLTEYAS